MHPKTAGCNVKVNVKIVSLLKIAINEAIYFYLCFSLKYIALNGLRQANPLRDWC